MINILLKLLPYPLNVSMGNCHRCLLENEGASRIQKRIVLLLAGLDNAGKTTTAKGLIGEVCDSEVPTVGFSSISLIYGKHSVIIYDLGGGAQIRGIWHRYFVDVHGVIFVVDASDVTRLDECRSVLNNLLTHPKLSGKPVLLLANKQDCNGALDELDIVEKLDLERLVNQQRCPTMVETCSATILKNSKRKLDPAIQNGYKWLVNCIIHNYNTLNDRVECDMAEQKITESLERRERMMRYINSKERNHGSPEYTNSEELFVDPFRPISELVVNSDNKQNNNGRIESEKFHEGGRQLNVLSDVNINRKPSCSSASTDAIKGQLELDKAKKSRFMWRSNKTGPAPLSFSISDKQHDISDPESAGQDSGFASPPKHLPPLNISTNTSENSAPWTHVPLSSASRNSLSQDGAWDLHKAFEVVPVMESNEKEDKSLDNLPII